MAARPRLVEALFGFRREHVLALFPPAGLVIEGVTAVPDEDGAVRVRFAGQVATRVPATTTLWLNLGAFVTAWPALVSELVARLGAEGARALLAEPALLESMEGGRLKDLILTHAIHAKDLHLLGETRCPFTELGAPPHFSIALPGGLLELKYTDDAYRAAHETPAGAIVMPALDVEVRFAGERIELDHEIGWTDADLAELAVLAHAIMQQRSAAVLELFDEVLDGPGGVLMREELAADVRAMLMNFWAVLLRRAGRLDEAVAMATQGLELARAKGETQLEQEILYNRGYARLQTTMKSRIGRDAKEVTLFTSSFDVDPKHRKTWTTCLADFEKALAMNPSDRSAASQVDLTTKLLALLDVNAAGGTAPKASTKRAAPKARATTPPTWTGFMPLVVVLVIAAVFLAIILRDRERAAPPPPPPTSVAHVHAPTAYERSETARLSALADVESLRAIAPSGTPCPRAVQVPLYAPEGEVIAPHLGRSIGTGELYGTEYFDATVRNWAMHYAPSADVLALGGPMGPVHETEPRSADVMAIPSHDYRVTLLVSSWLDPVILDGGEALTPGRLGGRLVVWDYGERRLVCATDTLEVENAPHLTIVRSPLGDADPEDDPLNRTRLDLVERALREGIPRLGAVP